MVTGTCGNREELGLVGCEGEGGWSLALADSAFSVWLIWPGPEVLLLSQVFKVV